MNKSIYKLIVVAVVVLCGCEKMLDVTPEDRVTGQNFWKDKNEVESTIIGAYSKLQSCVSSFFAWGELRSELVNVDGKSDGAREDVNNNMITEDNGFCDWKDVYSTINQFNIVVDYAPTVRALDKSFTEKELGYYMGEAKTMRALCYFYLARTFQAFPYITVGSKNDEQQYVYPALPGSQVLDSLIKDLKWAESRVRTDFNDVAFESARVKSLYEKGRVTQPLVWALLADIYLTKNQYSDAIVYLDKILNDDRFVLLPSWQWFDNFFPGNSAESIFELQFCADYDNAGGQIIKWYSSLSEVSGEQWYRLQRTQSTFTFKYWEGVDQMKPRMDIRGEGGTYPSRKLSFSMSGGIMVWKWAGKKYAGSTDSDYRNGTSNDPNWIFYRLADIYLMKAEALNRMEKSKDAADILKIIRDRANVIETIAYTNTVDLENQILDERAAELAFEGKRWFDLVRIARRQNNNFEVISKRIVEARYSGAGSYYEGIEKAKVNDPLSWYFPVHKNELERNYHLTQNLYYKTN